MNSRRSEVRGAGSEGRNRPDLSFPSLFASRTSDLDLPHSGVSGQLQFNLRFGKRYSPPFIKRGQLPGQFIGLLMDLWNLACIGCPASPQCRRSCRKLTAISAAFDRLHVEVQKDDLLAKAQISQREEKIS